MRVTEANLTVRFRHEKGADAEPRGEHWGQFQFAVLPRVGETLDAHHDGTFHTLVVTAVDRTALEQPIAHPELKTWHDAPSVRLVADWKWCE